MTNRNGETAQGGGAAGTTTDNDDWESMLDSGQLEKSLEQLAIAKRLSADTSDVTVATAKVSPRPLLDDPCFLGPVRILTHDGNPARTQYRPPEPQLKILKRPASDSTLANKTTESQPAPKGSQKTLKQREAEYAEARLRILGSHQPPPELKPTLAANNNNSHGQRNNNNGPRNNSGGQRSNGSRSAPPRPPRGPDGSKGFQQAR